MRFKLEPFAHQRKEFEEHCKTAARLLPWDPGVGKTKSCIDLAASLHLAHEISGVLVVAPNGVHRAWAEDEIPLHLSPDVENFRCLMWNQRKCRTKTFQQEMEKFAAHVGLSFLFISYDSLMTQDCANFVKNFFAANRCLYVLDESQFAKTPSAKRTIRVLATSKYAPYRRALSGTPIDDTPFDLYSQIKFLDHKLLHEYGVADFFSFKANFGVFEKRRVLIRGRTQLIDKVTGFRNLHILKQMVERIGTRVRKSEITDMPPKLFSKIYFEMTPEQRRIYEELRDEYRAWLSGEEFVTAAMAMTRIVRFQQITSGYVPGDDDGELIPIPGPNPRLGALATILEEVRGKHIIWAKYDRDVDLILELAKDMGRSAVRYDGLVPEEQRAVNKEEFLRGSAELFVSKTRVGGTGLNLQVASYMTFYNTTFEYGKRLQAEDRANRIGSTGALNIRDIVATGTVDEKIIESLRTKHEVASFVMGEEVRSWV